jgi:hypothetical protein
MYILTADAEGIARFEEILGITPTSGESLEDRRINVLSRNNKRKVTTALLEGILSNYASSTEIMKDYDNDELKIVLNSDAGSLQTIYDVLDEKIPLNVYYDFLLQRKEKINIGISSKVYQLYGRICGDEINCGNDNQITTITDTACDVNIGGICSIERPVMCGETVCGAAYGEMAMPSILLESMEEISLEQKYTASSTPYVMSGDKYSGEEG